MTVSLVSPEGLAGPVPYHHVAIASGTRQVHVAGQVGTGGAAADDLAAQVGEALRSTGTGLAAAGAGFADVVRLTFYVTRWRSEEMTELMAGIEAVAPDIGLPLPMPPSSLIGVEVLFEPGVRIEVEATAVLD